MCVPSQAVSSPHARHPVQSAAHGPPTSAVLCKSHGSLGTSENASHKGSLDFALSAAVAACETGQYTGTAASSNTNVMWKTEALNARASPNTPGFLSQVSTTGPSCHILDTPVDRELQYEGMWLTPKSIESYYTMPTFQAAMPGRNKVTSPSSAVWPTHDPTGLPVSPMLSHAQNTTSFVLDNPLVLGYGQTASHMTGSLGNGEPAVLTTLQLLTAGTPSGVVLPQAGHQPVEPSSAVRCLAEKAEMNSSCAAVLTPRQVV